MTTIRAPVSSAALMRADRSRAVKHAGPPVRVKTSARRPPSAMPRPQRSSTCWQSRPPLTGASDTPGHLPGFGILPADSVREVAKSATLKPLGVPVEVAPDPGYRPRAGTLGFVRWRDLTCRWPDCHRPVDKSDIDHTVPWAHGPTHPSNNKPYCRTHRVHKPTARGTRRRTDATRRGRL